MKVLVRFGLVVALVAATAPATAAEKIIAMGAGLQSCAEFAKAYREDASSEIVYFSWAQGYITASNLCPGFLTDLSAMSVDAQKRRIRAFCDQRPLKNYLDAAEAVFRELSKKRTGSAQ